METAEILAQHVISTGPRRIGLRRRVVRSRASIPRTAPSERRSRSSDERVSISGLATRGDDTNLEADLPRGIKTKRGKKEEEEERRDEPRADIPVVAAALART